MWVIETEQEEGGRWIAEVPTLPVVLAYGVTEADAIAKVKALARKIIAERMANGEEVRRDRS
jgi:predicted RNase H-like HicB family nuclease